MPAMYAKDQQSVTKAQLSDRNNNNNLGATVINKVPFMNKFISY